MKQVADGLPVHAVAIRVACWPRPFLGCQLRHRRESWLPLHAADRIFAGGLALDAGASEANAMLRALRAAGCFTLRESPSVVRTPRREAAAIVARQAERARAALPRRREATAAWELARLRQAYRRRLAIRFACRDILALPF